MGCWSSSHILIKFSLGENKKLKQYVKKMVCMDLLKEVKVNMILLVPLIVQHQSLLDWELKIAQELKKDNSKVVCVIGDGALKCWNGL